MSKLIRRRTLREHVSPTPYFKQDIKLPLENVRMLDEQYISSPSSTGSSKPRTRKSVSSVSASSESLD